jgi:hypothetical protein
MDFTIHFGTWVIPVFLTIICYLVALLTSPSANEDPWGMARMFFLLLATIGSLISWLAWALFR